MSTSADPELNPGNDTPQPTRRFGCTFWLILAGMGFVGVLFLLSEVFRDSHPATRRLACKGNLKQIGLALLNYHDDFDAFPPAYTVDVNGKPLHSWRTLILPYLDQLPLYNSIDLTKPWDDPVNSEFRELSLPVYRCPSLPSRDCPTNHTNYLASVAPNGFFRPTEPRQQSEITDGLANTLAVVEVPFDHSVPWMSPQDADEALVLLSIGPNPKLVHTGGQHSLLGDGAVRFLSEKLPTATRRALISIDGGDDAHGF